MDDRNTQMRIANLATRKKNFESKVTKLQEDITKIEEDITKANGEIQKLDDAIIKIRVRAEKENANDGTDQEAGEVGMETESDAAITTGALDASSQASGSGSAKPGWKFYNKIGGTQKRKKNKLNMAELMSRFIDSEEGE